MTFLRAITGATVVIPTVLALNGPNLGRLGEHRLEIYSVTALVDVESELHALAKELGVVANRCQSSYEGQFIEWIHEVADYGRPIIINPGGLTRTSVTLRNALAEIADGAGFHEVHISNTHVREELRHYSYLSALVVGVIVGCETDGYSMALKRIGTTL